MKVLHRLNSSHVFAVKIVIKYHNSTVEQAIKHVGHNSSGLFEHEFLGSLRIPRQFWLLGTGTRSVYYFPIHTQHLVIYDIITHEFSVTSTILHNNFVHVNHLINFNELII